MVCGRQGALLGGVKDGLWTQGGRSGTASGTASCGVNGGHGDRGQGEVDEDGPFVDVASWVGRTARTGG